MLLCTHAHDVLMGRMHKKDFLHKKREKVISIMASSSTVGPGYKKSKIKKREEGQEMRERNEDKREK